MTMIVPLPECGSCTAGDHHLARHDLHPCRCVEARCNPQVDNRNVTYTEGSCGCIVRTVDGRLDRAPYVICEFHERAAS